MPFIVRYNLKGKKAFRLSWAKSEKDIPSVIEKMKKQYGEGDAVVYKLQPYKKE